MTEAHPAIPFDNSYARLPGSMHVGVAPTPGLGPPADQGERAPGPRAGDRPRRASPRRWRWETSCCRAPPPSPRPMPGTSSAISCRSWAMGGRSCWARWWTSHGQRRDIQLKGSGRTPFSRGGDGRAALGPVLREYLVSEAMNALGIPTTRALMAATTGERVYRDDGAARRGADPGGGEPHPGRAPSSSSPCARTTRR